MYNGLSGSEVASILIKAMIPLPPPKNSWESMGWREEAAEAQEDRVKEWGA
jgi:hypothetical protein